MPYIARLPRFCRSCIVCAMKAHYRIDAVKLHGAKIRADISLSCYVFTIPLICILGIKVCEIPLQLPMVDVKRMDVFTAQRFSAQSGL